MFNLKEELKNLPEQPGVYLMHDDTDAVIYVGKAKILKNRVRQYFQNSANHTPKVCAMVSHIAYFEYIVTDSEMEALALECNLIKKYRPKYNILLKDDKNYPYIKVTIQEAYPKILRTRELKNDGAKYFGPYQGGSTVKSMLEMIQKIFKPPTCRRKFPEDIGKGRPCLNYHIKTCFAPCTGEVSREEYRKVFFDICTFLEGRHEKLVSELECEMKKASAEMEFERAAALRDQLRAIHALSEKQKIINVKNQSDADVIAIELLETKAFCEVFFVRAGKVIGRENYRMDQTGEGSAAEILGGFVKQFYAQTNDIPPEILTEYEIEDCDVVSLWLSQKRGKKVLLVTPQRGEKKKLVEMVSKNAKKAAENYQIQILQETEKSNVLIELGNRLGLSSAPRRIESYDISNISGADHVSSMVVFENGKPAPSKYRKFKIRTIEGANDYGAMQETLYRRFRHALEEEEKIAAGEIDAEQAKFLPYPNLILVDGGRGHVSAACEILESMELEIPVFGMFKDDRHRTKGLVGLSGEVELSALGSVFHLITRIQDEVHRTAIRYHRALHQKHMIHSELDEIPGIGEKRKKELLEHFKTIPNIKRATVEELLEADGINRPSAEAVWRFFHEGE